MTAYYQVKHGHFGYYTRDACSYVSIVSAALFDTALAEKEEGMRSFSVK